jgi:hypothetical protein
MVYNISQGHPFLPLTRACKQCIGCRLAYSSEWAIRIIHEAKLHEENEFITLTYNDEHLPKNHSLNKKHFQDFMKRLRKAAPGTTIRFYHAGEYGTKFQRPHYHACLFGIRFLDRKYWKTKNGYRYYISEALDQIWGKGHCTLGEVTFESAAYVARYITKKITGDKADDHYEYLNTNTGELTPILPEYTTMSRRPGIAKGWFEKYKTDVYDFDYVIANGIKLKPPKYYDSIFETSYPEQYENIRKNRVKNAKKYASNNTVERLKVREEIQQLKHKRLLRSYENDC